MSRRKQDCDRQPGELASIEFQKAVVERVTHGCATCGYSWKSLDSATERHVLTAMKVNKDGPYCMLCSHLEMADRYAFNRGFTSLESAIKQWRSRRAQRQAP